MRGRGDTKKRIRRKKKREGGRKNTHTHTDRHTEKREKRTARRAAGEKEKNYTDKEREGREKDGQTESGREKDREREKERQTDRERENLTTVHNMTSGSSTMAEPGNTKGGSISVPLTSCLTGLESAVGQQTTDYRLQTKQNQSNRRSTVQ
jgi:hypothetical protein